MHSYSCLDKQGRIRVEQWVQKLASVPLSPSSNRASNFNITWKKHRNAYAKLLLNMITTKHLSPPFSQLPPTGSLQPFPSHNLGQVSDVISRNSKHLLGPHETSFWRELFDSMQQSSVNSSFSSLSVGLRHDPTNTSFRDSEKENSEQTYRGLHLLTKEQAIRIKLLETQLREERIQHELLIERLQIQHREEMKSIAKLFEIHNSSDSNVSHMAPPPPPQEPPPQTQSNLFSDISRSYNVPDRMMLSRSDEYVGNHTLNQPYHSPRLGYDSSVGDDSLAMQLSGVGLSSQPQKSSAVSTSFNEAMTATRRFRYPVEAVATSNESLLSAELPRSYPLVEAKEDNSVTVIRIVPQADPRSSSSSSIRSTSSTSSTTSTSVSRRSTVPPTLLGNDYGGAFPTASSGDLFPIPRKTSISSQPPSLEERSTVDGAWKRNFSAPVANTTEYIQTPLVASSDDVYDNDNNKSRSVDSVDSLSTSPSIPLPVRQLPQDDYRVEGRYRDEADDYPTMGRYGLHIQNNDGNEGGQSRTAHNELKTAAEDDEFLRYIENFQKDIETLSIY
eukprot:gene28997-38041_t